MRIVERKKIDGLLHDRVTFIRIDPEDLQETLANILSTLQQLSWIDSLDEEYKKDGYRKRANETIIDIQDKFSKCIENNITKEAGEYIISELSREAIVADTNYLSIPLAELIEKKLSGNGGFDFYSENVPYSTFIFGEAKYSSNQSAYGRSASQIKRFIEEEKHIKDLPDLSDFGSSKAKNRVKDEGRGFAIAFSTKNITSDKLIENIKRNADFKILLSHEEILVIAVNI